jgi:hypothetical protein
MKPQRVGLAETFRGNILWRREIFAYRTRLQKHVTFCRGGVAMKRIPVVLILVVSLGLLAVKHLLNLRAALGAPLPPFQQSLQEGKGCSAPTSWGELKGVADRAIAFEDSSGTIRVLDTGPCMRGETQLIVKITRQ